MTKLFLINDVSFSFRFLHSVFDLKSRLVRTLFHFTSGLCASRQKTSEEDGKSFSAGKMSWLRRPAAEDKEKAKSLRKKLHPPIGVSSPAGAKVEQRRVHRSTRTFISLITFSCVCYSWEV